MGLRLRYLLLTTLILLLDQGTKAWALARLRPVYMIEVIPDFFRLTFATNRGVAFSLFADGPEGTRYLLSAIALLAAVMVTFQQWRMPAGHRRVQWSLSLLLAGILGNLIDRIRFGEVIDFLDFHLAERYAWPTFNIADAVICVGAGLLAIELLREERRGRGDVS
jgi:signal peptidase II